MEPYTVETKLQPHLDEQLWGVGRENHGEYLQNRWRKEGLPTKWHLYWQQTCQHNGSGQERTESGLQSAERK